MLQGRAVTPEDYKTIIPKVYANTKSVQVWGGEDNSTPVFGRSYISIVPTSGSITMHGKGTNCKRTEERIYNCICYSCYR